MLSWKVHDIAKAVGALNIDDIDPTLQVTSVSFDSRSLQVGALFVPLIDRNDGHDYIESALDKGAVSCFWSRDLDLAPVDIQVIQVEDTHQALMDFAKSYLQVINPKVVAITGSNGKTTTKDMTAAVLQTSYRTHKTEGNFNNNIGLPMTILEMPRDTDYLVLEMGMNHRGEIHELSLLAEPDLAVITMVGESHIEYLGSRKGIAAAKFEIIDGLKDQGILIYNGDEDLLNDLVVSWKQLKTATVGNDLHNDLHPLFIESMMKKTTFSTNVNPKQTISLPVPGEYNVINALCAISVGMKCGVAYDDIVEGLTHFQLTANRLEWLDGIRSSHLLNDAYNASPTSMKASIQGFSAVETDCPKWLVLGEMGELGEFAEAYHRDLSLVIDAEDADHVILYGTNMEGLFQDLRNDPEFRHVDLQFFDQDVQELLDYIGDHVEEGAYLLFKSSFSTNLIAVAKALEVGG